MMRITPAVPLSGPSVVSRPRPAGPVESFEGSVSLEQAARKLLSGETEKPTARFAWADIASPPAVGPEGTLYLAVRGSRSSYEGRLEARTQDGQVLWSVPTRGSTRQSPLWHDGKLIVAHGDPHSVSTYDAGTGKLLASHPDVGGPLVSGRSGVFAATPRWRRLGPSNPRQAVVAVGGSWKFFLQPTESLARLKVAPDGQLYASTNEGTLYALDPATGRKLWQSEAPHGRFALDQERVYVPTSDGTTVVALDHQGRPQSSLDGFRQAEPCGVSPQGVLLVADRTNAHRTDLRAYDREGQKLWTALVQDPRIEEVLFDRRGRSMISSGDFAGRCGAVECFSPTGQLLWRSGLRDSPRLALGPEDELYALDVSHQLYALDDPAPDPQAASSPRLVNLRDAVVVGGVRLKRKS